MLTVSDSIRSFSEERGVLVVRVMSGSFMTSLEMAGMSLSLMKVDEEMLRLFGEFALNPILQAYLPICKMQCM